MTVRKLLGRWQVRLGAALLSLSVLLFALDWLVYRNPDTWFYLAGDIAFIPFSVLVVTLILSGIFERQARKDRLQKLNMVIGVFFSEVGTDLLRRVQAFGPLPPSLAERLGGLRTDPSFDYGRAAAELDAAAFSAALRRDQLGDLQAFLREKRDFLLRLLENPNLLEHETFTELLWAVFHMVEEFSYRTDIAATPDSDVRHLQGDMNRVYGLLVREWLKYMGHLKTDYPYLFSLALRLNPFDAAASTVVKG